jgi:hypothetical protein
MTDPLPIWRAAVRADCARIVADLFEPLRMAVFGNPLLPPGTYCGTCGLRLNKTDVDAAKPEIAACPMCTEAAS